MKKLFILISIMASSAFANPLYMSDSLNSWPSFTLQHEFAPDNKDMIDFKETDFISLRQQVERSKDPMIPTVARKNFDESLSFKGDNIKWRVFMTAVAGNRVSGFSQGIGMTTMLIENELYLDAEIEHLNYNFKNRYLDKYYSGEKYRYNTTLHWYPTDDFSLHLGIGGLVDQ